MTTSEKQTLGFQTEAKQLLQLMIHSLYSNKEVFLRELISNASDAADKLRFETLAKPELYEGDADLRIRIEFDREARTLTLHDNGIGMSREEAIANLGTIARSGTKEFFSHLSADARKDAALIGQFGVGFYSAFIVAEKVEVITRRAGLPADQGVHWSSTGEADFTVEQVDKPSRGTTLILHLREDALEFADYWRIRHVVKKYSDHIALPVVLRKPAEEGGEAVDETVNTAQALWTRPRNDISDEEYREFYKHISHDFEEPLTWSHNRVEGKLEYTSLLYVPKRAPFDLWQRDGARGLKLYVQRTFVMDDAEQFLPLYLRFIKGVVDSSDLPLNVSRELLQRDANVDRIKTAVTKRVLEMLEQLASQQPAQYDEFWKAFGLVLKEGVAEDFANRERIAGLLRFASTKLDTPEQSVSLADYVARMPPSQNRIYYVVAENFNTARNSPHLEVLRKKGIEVLLLSERIDEWVMGSLREFDGRALQDVSKGALDLGELETEEERKEQEQLAEAHKGLVERLREALSAQVREVRVTHRLTESPACLAMGEDDMGLQMRRILEAAGQSMPASQPVFEVNPSHPLVIRLEQESEPERFAEWAHVLLDQARLAEGRELEDPAAFVKRLNQLILQL